MKINRIIAFDIGNGRAKASLLENWDGDPQSLLPPEMGEGMPTVAYAGPDGTIEVYGIKKKRLNRKVYAVKTRFKEAYIELTEDGNTYHVNPFDVYAAIARDLVMLVNRTLTERGSEPIYDIVVTYPAAFSKDSVLLGKIKHCLEAVEVNGNKLTVRAMLSEPSAAAIDCLYFKRNLAQDSITVNNYTALACDIGHGTTDVAVVTSTSDPTNPFQLICQDGTPEVGGRIFDDLLYEEICRQINYTPSSATEEEVLRETAIEIKHELSRIEVSEHNVFFPTPATITITRARLEELIMPLLNNVLEMVAEQLETAKQKGFNIDAVILSGGGSKMPAVKNAIEKLTQGEYPIEIYRPTDAISFGAARYAFVLKEKSEPDRSNRILEQLTEYPICVCVNDGNSLYETLEVFIKENEKLPCTSKRFEYSSNECRHSVKLAYPDENASNGLGRKEIVRIPFDIPGKNLRALTLHMDENRCITVTCHLNDGTTLKKKSFDMI